MESTGTDSSSVVIRPSRVVRRAERGHLVLVRQRVLEDSELRMGKDLRDIALRTTLVLSSTTLGILRTPDSDRRPPARRCTDRRGYCISGRGQRYSLSMADPQRTQWILTGLGTGRDCRDRSQPRVPSRKRQ